MNKMNEDFNAFVLFSEIENAALDDRSFEREVRGEIKQYATCLIRNKDVPLKQEERVRQLWLDRLTGEYGYPASRIQVE